MINNNTIYIISAPSGVGKTSLIKEYLKSNQHDDVKISISYTTRLPRKNEINGKDYYFINRTKFEEFIMKDEFIEFATIFDNYYGTSKQEIYALLKNGNNIILEIDWQGAQQVKKIFLSHNIVTIFILPPSIEVLKQRLIKRNLDHDTVIKKRMNMAEIEIKKFEEYDYIITNDIFEEALFDLKTIFNVQKLKNNKLS